MIPTLACGFFRVSPGWPSQAAGGCFLRPPRLRWPTRTFCCSCPAATGGCRRTLHSSSALRPPGTTCSRAAPPTASFFAGCRRGAGAIARSLPAAAWPRHQQLTGAAGAGRAFSHLIPAVVSSPPSRTLCLPNFRAGPRSVARSATPRRCVARWRACGQPPSLHCVVMLCTGTYMYRI